MTFAVMPGLTPARHQSAATRRRSFTVQISSTPVGLSIPDIRSSVGGEVIGPDDPGYDEARQVFSGAIDKRPAVIVRVADASDVVRVLELARETGLELAVRGGGHSVAGHSVSEGGIVLDLSAMKALDFDPSARTVWADAGLTAREVTDAAAEHGLAIGFGDTGSVGIGGITLGGGIGYLVRKHGLTIDNLVAAEIVTADGELRRTDKDNEPELFWAIRGGGGNFGVVTRFRFALNPLDGVVGGLLILPATPETIAGFIAAAEAAPEELSTIANVMTAPPMPFLPEDVVGQTVILGIVCYAGDAADGERALAPFRALATPLADMVQPMPYPQIYPPDDESYRPTAAGTTLFIDHVDTEVAQTILDRLAAIDSPMRVAQLRVLGGAVARVPAETTAFAHRDARIMVNLAAFFGPHDRAEKEAWVVDFRRALQQGDSRAYVNFLGDEGEDRVRAAYPGATWGRLVAVKQQYDPTNLFRLNQNIPPTAGAS
jgi:FAD/FMN-containing dehydrogenase